MSTSTSTSAQAAPTYTLDVQFPNGRYGSDYGLTAAQVAQARDRCPALGVTILAVIEETEPDPRALRAFGVRL